MRAHMRACVCGVRFVCSLLHVMFLPRVSAISLSHRLSPLAQPCNHQIPITIVYLDSHERGLGSSGGDGSGAECEVHRFEPSSEGAGAIVAAAHDGGGGGAAGARKPSVHLLYRPGHYDVACECCWRAGSGGLDGLHNDEFDFL